MKCHLMVWTPTVSRKPKNQTQNSQSNEKIREYNTTGYTVVNPKQMLQTLKYWLNRYEIRQRLDCLRPQSPPDSQGQYQRHDLSLRTFLRSPGSTQLRFLSDPWISMLSVWQEGNNTTHRDASLTFIRSTRTHAHTHTHTLAAGCGTRTAVNNLRQAGCPFLRAVSPAPLQHLSNRLTSTNTLIDEREF